MTSPPLLVAGSIALDTLQGPERLIVDELGGSALYFALAASLVMPVSLIAPVGRADVSKVEDVVGSRPIDLTHLQIYDAPTYRWTAQQVAGRNIDLGSRDSIYDLWHPVAPDHYTGWAFVGSVRPDRQVNLMEGLAGAQLLAADSMISYIHARQTEAFEVLRRARWYFCNEQELEALGGTDPEAFRRRWSLECLVVKAGPRGVRAYLDGKQLAMPALTGHDVVDTTGAGDAVAAGTLARWLQTGARPSGLEEALAWGVACASLTIEDIGLRAIARATAALLHDRVAEITEIAQRAS